MSPAPEDRIEAELTAEREAQARERLFDRAQAAEAAVTRLENDLAAARHKWPCGHRPGFAPADEDSECPICDETAAAVRKALRPGTAAFALLEEARVWIMTAHCEPSRDDLPITQNEVGHRLLKPTMEGWTKQRAALLERLDAALAGTVAQVPEPMIPVERARQYTAAAKGYLQMIAGAASLTLASEIRADAKKALEALDRHEDLCHEAVATFGPCSGGTA